jgi:hypothetical protein
MIRVRFLSDQVVDDCLVGTDRETSFVEGQVVDLKPDSARHWLTRGLAETVDQSVPVGIPERKEVPMSAGDGESQETGMEKPSSALLPGQASETETSSGSDKPAKTGDAKPSSSTDAGKKRRGQTSSTARTPRGGKGRKTRLGSKG